MGVITMQEEEASVEIETEERASLPVPFDCREYRRYGFIRGCRCDWNASLPLLKANQDGEKILIRENATGETPYYLKPDVIYRVTSVPSLSLPVESVREVQEKIAPALREKGLSPDALSTLSYDIPKEASYAKEMRSQLYKAFRIKVPDTVLSEIGTIARRHLESQEEEFLFSLTREYDRDPHFYLNGGSCYYDAGCSYAKSMCHCKRFGVCLFLKIAPDVAVNSLRELYESWEKDMSQCTEKRRGVLFRSLVIPVSFTENRYKLSPQWEREMLTRFVVTNTYRHEYDERAGSYSNSDGHIASLLAKSLHAGSEGKNASLCETSGGSSFYMNGRGDNSSRNTPIVHVGREAPRTRFLFDACSPCGDITCGYHYGDDDDGDYDDDDE
jgi:hypothetical protein